MDDGRGGDATERSSDVDERTADRGRGSRPADQDGVRDTTSPTVGSSADRDTDQIGTVLIGFGAGAVGFLAMIVWTFVLGAFAIPFLGGELTPIDEVLLSTLALGFGMATGAAIYLWWSDRTIAFIDLHVPSLRDVVYTVGGVVGLFAALFAISWITQQLGVPASEHGIIETAREGDPTILLVLVPLSILIIGPGEELLFRNVVQKLLYDAFSRSGAIVIASVIFAIVHVPAYLTGTPSQVATSIVSVFVLSLLLGWIYHRTENLVVPALIHGLYNAVLFATLYAELTGVV